MTELCNIGHCEAVKYQKRIDELKNSITKNEDSICQTLGKALGYPWYKDDLKNFPDATDADGVCVGDHVAASIAMTAANKIDELEAENKRLTESR